MMDKKTFIKHGVNYLNQQNKIDNDIRFKFEDMYGEWTISRRKALDGFVEGLCTLKTDRYTYKCWFYHNPDGLFDEHNIDYY